MNLSTIWKIVAVLAVAAALFAYGRSTGYNSGYTKAWDAQQKTIKQMVDVQNAQTDAQNKKIEGLQTDAVDAASRIRDLQDSLQVQQGKTITKYIDRYPQIAASCGLSEPTILTINELITGTGG